MSHYKKMLVEDWIKVQDNPIQRDTEKHAAKAKHLHTAKPTHYFVTAGELPNGTLIKLDGHTRALLWKRKEIPVPMQVNVAIIPIKSKEEAEELYKTLDSKDAVENQRDKVFGAFRNHDFQPQSGMLQSGSLTQALRIAYSVLKGGVIVERGGIKGGMTLAGGVTRKEALAADVYEMIDEFSPELHTLDGFGLRQNFVGAGVVAACLLSYRKYGNKVTPYWTGVFGNAGNKHGREMDMIQATTQLIQEYKGNYGGSAARDMCSRCLTAIEKWMKDDVTYRIPKSMDMAGYLVGHKRPTERLIKAKDLEKAKIDRERKVA